MNHEIGLVICKRVEPRINRVKGNKPLILDIVLGGAYDVKHVEKK